MDGEHQLEYPLGHVVARRGAPLAAPRVSRDDAHLAVIEKVSAIETRGRVTILDRAGAVIASSSYHGGVIGLVWAPDDREVWFSTWTGDDADNGLFALDLAGHERLLLRGGGVYSIQDVARDGRLLMQRLDNRMRMYRVAPGAPARDVGWLDGSEPYGISADGATLAFDESMGTGEQPDGYATYVRRGDAPPVLVAHSFVSVLLPDASAVIAISGESAPLARVPTGTGAPSMLPRGAIDRFDVNDLMATSWDGRWLVVRAAAKNGAMRLWLQDLRGGDPAPVGPDTIAESRHHPVSPDGAWIAFGADDRGVRLISTRGEPERKVAGAPGDEPISFRRDGRALFVLAEGHYPRTVYLVDLATGRRSPWLTITAPDTGESQFLSIVIDADGDQAAYGVFTPQSDLYVIEPPATR